MGVLGNNELSKLIQKYRCLHPHEERLMDGDGYVLTVRDEITLNYLEHQNIISNQVVFVPPNFVAHLTAKSKYGRMGLSFLNAAKVHSGFVGRLALEIVNLSNDRRPITIRTGEPFMHMEFLTREGDPDPYIGPYQFQFMSDEETSIYLQIMTKEFSLVFPEDVIKKLILNRIS